MSVEYVTFQDLYKAYKDCRKHKRNKLSSVQFEANLYENLQKLYEELNSGTYTIGVSITFVVTRPKYREVFAADFRDRIVHHLLIRRLEPYFESYFDDSAYACRKGKGTLYGIKDIRSKMMEVSENFTKDAWILKTDIEGFFMNIDKGILKKNLKEFMLYNCSNWENLGWWINLAMQIIDNRPELNCERHGDLSLWSKLPKEKSLFSTDGSKGLPIGNLTSQFFANFYLTPCDKHLRKMFKILFGRYADDRVSMGQGKCKDAIPVLREERRFLKDELKIALHRKKVYLQPIKHGITSFGTVITGSGALIPGRRTIGNAWTTIREEQLNHLPARVRLYKMVQRVNSYFGYFKVTQSYKVRKLYSRIILSSRFRPFIESQRSRYMVIKRQFKKLNLE